MRIAPSMSYTDLVGNSGRFSTATSGNNVGLAGGGFLADSDYLTLDAITSSASGNWVAFIGTLAADL